MNIADALLGMGLQSGRLQFHETETHYSLYAKLFSMEILISSLSKADIQKAEAESRRAKLSVVS
ncbi:MAG: hypothetical protein DI537_14025 [Stutzerimonas stutzeri]|nr:MAG: hypothetical protein DI537_14025 [Stutzerimonas stutzeri]